MMVSGSWAVFRIPCRNFPKSGGPHGGWFSVAPSSHLATNIHRPLIPSTRRSRLTLTQAHRGCIIQREAVLEAELQSSAGTKSKSPKIANSTWVTRSLLPPGDGKMDEISTGTTKTRTPRPQLRKRGEKNCERSRRLRQLHCTPNSDVPLLHHQRREAMW